MKRKSIVLSDVEGESTKKAVLTLEEKDSGLVGTLRLYNFPHEPNGILSLGMFCKNKVIKSGLTRKSQMLYDFFVSLDEIPAKFSCAVVNFQNAEPKPVLFGSSEGSDENVYASIISEVSGVNSFSKTQETLDKYGVDFDEEEKKEIEKEIDENLCHENCGNCIYKKYFYENAHDEFENAQDEKFERSEQVESLKTNAAQQENFKAQMFGAKNETSAAQTLRNSKSEEIFHEKTASFGEKTNVDEKTAHDEISSSPSSQPGVIFFDRLKPQIDKLFENNPAENNLQNLFPSSKWVKVEYEDEGDFFVFGLLYDEDGNVKYVCYGVPAVFDENPPEELAGYPIWLPLDDEKGFGYWMTYQDAVTGEPLKAILD